MALVWFFLLSHLPLYPCLPGHRPLPASGRMQVFEQTTPDVISWIDSLTVTSSQIEPLHTVPIPNTLEKPLPEVPLQTESFDKEQQRPFPDILFRLVTRHYPASLNNLSPLERAKHVFKDFPLYNSVKITIEGDEQYYLKGPDGKLYIYRKKDKLAAGAGGRVYKALECTTDTQVAIKVSFVTSGNFEVYLHKLMGSYVGEAIYPKLNIYFFSPKNQFLPQRYIQGRTLEEEFKDYHSPFDKVDLYRQAIDRLRELHRYDYCHGDAHLGNYLVEKTLQGVKVWLIDFDHSRYCVELQGKIDDYKMLRRFIREELAADNKVRQQIEEISRERIQLLPTLKDPN